MKPELKALRTIPGVGPSIAQDLWDLGYRRPEGLKDQNPEAMYSRHMEQRGCHVDRCLLYVFRYAVYYASTADHDPELLKWWRWKDGR